MKRACFFLICIVICLLSPSCEKETILSVSQSSINIPDAGGSQSITLTANKPWSVSSNQSWCKVSPSFGEEATNSKITITCDANTTYDERICTVTFTCAEMTSSVYVTQATNNGLLVSQKEYSISNEAQQLNIEVKANVKFSVEVDEACKNWVKYNTTKGLTTSTVVLDISKNEEYDSREGKVTIKQTDGNLSETIVIKQGQLDGLFLTTSEYNLSDEQHTLTVEVKSNIEFEVKSEAEWIKYVETKGLKTNQIILNVAANDTYDEREGKVTVIQKNGNLTGTIVIKQDEKYGILVSQSEYKLSNEAQTIEVEVKYNVEFDVVISQACKDWVSLVGTKGLSSIYYTFSVAKNETYEGRECPITFKQINGPLSETIVIKQEQTDFLSAEKEKYILTHEEQTLCIKVYSNIDYVVEIEGVSQSWISMVHTKAMSETNVIVQISKNEEDERTGYLTIKGNEEVVRVNIVQNGKNPTIYYTTTDGKPVCPNSAEGISSDKLEIISNTYEDGVGRLVLKDTVTVLPMRAFAYCNTLKTITIPYGITALGDYTFMFCTSLESVELPNTLTVISKGSFSTCTRLNTIDLPQSLTYIGPWSFNSCENLLALILPNGIKEICYGIASGCANLKEVYIPDSVEMIQREAFMSCPSLESIILPKSVTEIHYRAFAYCPSLKRVELNEGLRRIDQGAFRGCSNLRQITIPESVFSMGAGSPEGVFEDCINLVSATLFDGVQEIGAYLFKNCTSLVEVRLSESITTMNGTFSGCSSLKTAHIPDSVTILDEAFSGCSSLETIHIPEAVKSIRGSFSGCSSLKSIQIPESVISMESAFSSSGIERITLPPNITSLDGTFSNCKHLIEIDIPHGVDKINCSFLECTSLSKVSLPNSVKEIVSGFVGCSGLKSIDLPDSLLSLNYHAFYNCTSLESIIIPKSVNFIGDEPFIGCDNLKTIKMLSPTPPKINSPKISHYYLFPQGIKIIVPRGALEAYLCAPGWWSFYNATCGTIVESD